MGFKVFINAEEKAEYLFNLYDHTHAWNKEEFINIVMRETINGRVDTEVFWALMDIAFKKGMDSAKAA